MIKECYADAQINYGVRVTGLQYSVVGTVRDLFYFTEPELTLFPKVET